MESAILVIRVLPWGMLLKVRPMKRYITVKPESQTGSLHVHSIDT